MVEIWVGNWLFHIGSVGLGFGLARLYISTQATTVQRGRDLQNRSFHWLLSAMNNGTRNELNKTGRGLTAEN